MTREKNWNFIEGLWTSTGDVKSLRGQKFLLRLKAWLVTYAGWKVIGSCDAVDYEYEGVTSGGSYSGESTNAFDRWEGASDLVRQTAEGGSNLSWCVLRGPTSTKGTPYCVVAFLGTDDDYATFYFYPSKPALGATPLNTMPRTVPFNGFGHDDTLAWIYTGDVDQDQRGYFAGCSEDGSFVLTTSSTVHAQYTGLQMFHMLAQDDAINEGWGFPAASYLRARSTNWTWYVDTDQFRCNHPDWPEDSQAAAVCSPFYGSSPTRVLAAMSSEPDSVDGRLASFPAYLYCFGSSTGGQGLGAIVGRIEDVFLCPEALVDGDVGTSGRVPTTGTIFPTIPDEGQSGAFPIIPDESTSGNNGTMTNMLASNIQVPVPWGKFSQYSYQFDGVAEYLNFGDVLAYEGTDAFSWSFWVYLAAFPGVAGFVIAKEAPALTYRGYAISISPTGEVWFSLYNDYAGGAGTFLQVRTDAVLALGTWAHVCVTYDGSEDVSGVTILVDGTPKSLTSLSNTLAGTIVTGDDLNIARRPDNTYHLAAFLSDVAVYDKELSSGEAAYIYNSGTPNDLRAGGAPSNLVAYWRLGDGGESPQSTWTHKVQQWKWDATATKESATITDASHLNSPGTLLNMVAGDVTTDTPGGLSGYSCTFDGINKCMMCADTSTLYTGYNLGNGEACSVAGWVKTTASTGWLWGNGRPFAAGLPNFIGYGVYLDGGRPTFILTSNSGSTAKLIRRGDNTLNDGGWHFVVVTKFKIAANNHRVRIYVDGVLQPTTLLNNAVGNNSVSGGGWRCGGQYNTVDSLVYQPLAGQLDEMSVWSKELTQADVTALWNGGAPTDLRDHAPTYLYLRGWWRMGDAYLYPGATVAMEYYDKSGWAPGTPVYTNRSCYFDSSNDYVLIGDVPEIDFEYNEPFSVSAWILPWGINAFRGVASKCTSYTAPGWQIDYYGGAGGTTYFPYGFLRVVFTANGGTGQGFFEVSPGSNYRPLPFGSWLHLVMAYDGSNDANGIKFYINGELIPTQVRYNIAFVASLRNSTPVEIGHAQGYWSGFEDEVSIWDKELDQADVTELFNGGDPANLAVHSSVASLVGWWRMGELTLDGTARGMTPTVIGTDIPGGLYSTKSMTFDGVNGYVTIGDNLNFDYNEAFSFSAWIKTSATAIGTVIGKRDSSGRGYWVFLEASGKIGFRHTNTETTNEIYITSTSAYNDGSWKHLAVTFDGTNASGVTIYVNGSAVALDAATYDNLTATTDNAADLMIGGREQVPRYRFDGLLDEVSAYGAELSGADVTAIYNGGLPTDLSALSSASNMVGWWRMGEGVLSFLNEYFVFSGLLWLPASTPPEFGP